eukprot:g10960.t1
MAKLREELGQAYTELDENDMQLYEKDKLLEQKDRLLEEKDKQLYETDKLLEGKDKLLEGKDILLEEKSYRLEQCQRLLSATRGEAPMNERVDPKTAFLNGSSVFGRINVVGMLICAVTIFSYRIAVRLFPKKRLNLLLFVKCCIGFAIGNLFLHGVSEQSAAMMNSGTNESPSDKEAWIFLGNLFFLVLAGGPDCVVITLAYAWLAGSCSFLLLSGVPESLLYLNPDAHAPWVRHLAVSSSRAVASVIVLGLAFVLTLVFIGVRGCFSNWELVTLPPLAATALLASVADAPAFVVAGDPVSGSLDVWPVASVPLLWSGVYVCGVLLHCLSQSKTTQRRINVDDPYGGQNDLMRRLLTDTDVTRNDMFESRFPIVQGMGKGQADPADP